MVMTFATLSHTTAQRYTTAATKSPSSSSHDLSPRYLCHSSARATPFAACSCLYLGKCVIHIHFSAFPGSDMFVTTHVGTHTARSSATHKKSASTDLAGTQPATGADPPCWTWPFPEASAWSPAYGQFWTSKTCWTWPHSQCGQRPSSIINIAAPFCNGIQDQRPGIPHRS